MLTKHHIEIKYSLITLALLAGFRWLDPLQGFGRTESIIGDFIGLMSGLGLVGFFVVSLIANGVPLVRIPYNVALLSLALGGASLHRMLLIGAACGLGGGIGKMISYAITLKVMNKIAALENNSLFYTLQRIINSRPRIARLLVFFWIVSPLPNDLMMIPLAMVRYGIKQISLPLLTGRFINNIGLAASFYYFTAWSAGRVSNSVQADLAFGSLIVFVMLMVYQVEKNHLFAPKLEVFQP